MLLEKAIALQGYDHLLESQGISRAEIAELKVFKEYKYDTTALIAYYQNDPLKYRYKYTVESFAKGKMRVGIYNERNESIFFITNDLTFWAMVLMALSNLMQGALFIKNLE